MQCLYHKFMSYHKNIITLYVHKFINKFHTKVKFNTNVEDMHISVKLKVKAMDTKCR